VTATFSQETAEKALRLVHENRVTLLPLVSFGAWYVEAGRDFALVAGQTRSHTVIADAEGVRCSCKAWRINRPCSHQLASMIVWASEDAKLAAGVVGATASGDAAKAAGPRGATVVSPRAARAPHTKGDAA
jgi:hypothetical protein